MTQGLYLFDQNFYSSLWWLCTTGTRLLVVGVTSEAGEGEAPKYLAFVCARGLLSCGYDLAVIVSGPSFYSSRRVYITIALPVRKTKMGPLLHVSDVPPPLSYAGPITSYLVTCLGQGVFMLCVRVYIVSCVVKRP